MPNNICKQIFRFINKGIIPSQIHVILKNLYNFRLIKNITVNKIFRIMKFNSKFFFNNIKLVNAFGLFLLSLVSEISKDLYYLIKKAIVIYKYLKYNCSNKNPKF